jgi:hypothetical protein
MKRGVKLVVALLLSFGMLASVSAIKLQVSGLEDGEVYDSRRLEFDLVSDDYNDFFLLKDSSDIIGRWRRLCRDDIECEKSYSFSEGENNVAFKVINDEDVSKIQKLSFFIDSRDPRAGRTYPRRGSVVNSRDRFSVSYSEDNVQLVRFHYWFDGQERTMATTNCPSGRGVECSFAFPSALTEDGELTYWFEVMDKAGNVDVTRETEVYVDNTEPKLLRFEMEESRRRVNFMIEMEEENFDEIYYIDKMEADPREHRLCSVLRHGRCTARKSFRTSGDYVWDIFARDEAGNVKTIRDDLVISV